MRKELCILLFVLSFLSSGAECRPKSKLPYKLLYDIDLNYNFDNREFDTGRIPLSPSQTLHFISSTTLFGISLGEEADAKHNILAGITVFKHMGDRKPLLDILKEGESLLYYNYAKQFANNSHFEFYAGVFPRQKSGKEYGRMFFSDSVIISDKNIEGAMLSYASERIYFELGLDWMGKFGSGSRERFMIFSRSVFNLAKKLKTGCNFTGYHYANMEEYGGVVDNYLAEPYISLDCDYKKLYSKFTFGYLQSVQQDRIKNTGFEFPKGVIFEYEAKLYSFGISNSLYAGNNIMPYYHETDIRGMKYGNNLYFGEPFYSIVPYRDKNIFGGYNRFELYWRPAVSKYVSLELSFSFHSKTEDWKIFTFEGTQQRLSLILNFTNK